MVQREFSEEDMREITAGVERLQQALRGMPRRGGLGGCAGRKPL